MAIYSNLGPKRWLLPCFHFTYSYNFVAEFQRKYDSIKCDMYAYECIGRYRTAVASPLIPPASHLDSAVAGVHHVQGVPVVDGERTRLHKP